MSKKENINVQGTAISILTHRQDDYISLTDMAKFKNAEIPGTVVSHWMSTVFSINYMDPWEKINNPDFNLTGFREIKAMSVETGFALSPKQGIERTNAVGIMAKPGRYGGTYAHRDIVFEFATWLSPEFNRMGYQSVAKIAHVRQEGARQVRQSAQKRYRRCEKLFKRA